MENKQSIETIIQKPTTLLNLCIKSASKNKNSIEKWRRQRRTLEKLPPHLANQLLHRLLHRRLLFPSLLEVFQYCVEEINLSGENMVDSEWMAYLGAFRFLKCLNVADCRGVNNSSIWPITGMDCLKELDLSRCQKLTDACVLHLISIQNMEKLSVAETSLTMDGVKQLSALTKLSVLDLGGLPVTDMALSSLQKPRLGNNVVDTATTPAVPRYRPAHSDDPGWEYGQPHEGNVGHIVCDFCGHLSKGGIRRFKHHLVKKSYLGTKDEPTYKDVAPCDKVPDNIVKLMREYMEEKAKKADAKKKVRDEAFKSINVYGVGDDDEDGAQNVPKRVKGPIQQFLVPMEGPKFPTNKENKKALENIHGYIGDFFYENGIAFNCAKSDSYKKMWAVAVQYNDPSTFKPPSYEDLRVKILKKKKDNIHEWLGGFKDHWETYGITIMTDWWTDGKGRTLINFLVNCPTGTVFLKSIDGSEHIHDAKLIYDMLKDVIQEVGEKNVIQVCTDNATNYKLAGDWLMQDSKIYWMPCGAHCVNLALKDIGNLPIVQSVVLDAQAVSVFIYNHKHVLRLMRDETKGREIVRPSVTRFATNFLCLQSMYDKRQHLRDMIHTQKWRNSKWPKHPSAKEVVKTIKSNTFWNNMHYCLKIMAPLVDVLRMVDTEEKPSMPYIYKAMEICKAKVKANIGEQTQEDCEMSKKVERIIDSRWADMLQKPLHLAAHYLNPQHYFATPTSGREMEANTVVKEGLLNCIEKLAMDDEDQQQILRDVVMYRQKKGRFGRNMAQSCVQTYPPGEWWESFGSEVPALQRFARRVLGLTSSASPCERNWSTFNNCLTKLEYLDIWGSKISNNGTALLKAFGKLRFLNIAWTKVTTLPYLPSLTCLNMSNCSVQSIFEEVHYKAKPSHLEKLHITGITSTNANDIFTNINPRQLSFLDLSSSPLQNFEFLVTMTSLQHLDISSCGLKDDSIELIAQIGTTLKFLNLSNTRLRSSAIASLAGCVPNIEILILSETEVDDDVLLYISMMPSLKVLDLSCNANITGKGKGKGEILSLSALQTLKHLEKLTLDGTQVRDTALQPLASVEKLKFLSLRSDFISDESLHILSSFRKLEILGIRGAVLSNDGLYSFNPPPKLKILDLRDSWLLSKDAVLSFQDYHPMIEVKHKHVEFLSTAQITSSHRSPGHTGHRNFRVVPSKSKWTNFSSVPPQIRKDFFVDERLKYNREELLELQQSPLSQISYLDGNTVLPDTV